MTRASSSTSPLGRLWKTLTSLRLTLALLIILAVVSLVGTIRPQVFDTPWFLAPLGLLALNLIACLIRGLPQAVHRVRQPLTPAAALTLPERACFPWPATPDPHQQAEAALRRQLGRVQKEVVGEQTVYFRERGRFRPLGPYVVHLALLVILAGALVGKFLGVEGQLTLAEGETARDFTVGGTEKPLDFTARLDRFQVLYYPDGTPREFRSDLTFTRPGQAPQQAVCRVNEPVGFGDYTFYQASYGNIVRLEVRQGENSRIVEAPVGQTVRVPGGQGRVRVLEYQPDLVMPGKDKEIHLGPAARLVYWEEDGRPRMVMVLENRPEMADKQPGPYRFYLKGSKSFAVLQVKRDPGVWWVYAGFLLLLPGFYLAFLRPAERWALVLRPQEKGTWEVRLLGAAPRAKEAFQDRLERLHELLMKKGGAA
jgi:cytochrome c biogenesis protein|uniref:ResB-like domain-containing protein n=1 Tax=Desulfobacca acetoxidans TaxID=60893 RepID=A0A7V6DR91_9BACT